MKSNIVVSLVQKSAKMFYKGTRKERKFLREENKKENMELLVMMIILQIQILKEKKRQLQKRRRRIEKHGPIHLRCHNST